MCVEGLLSREDLSCAADQGEGGRMPVLRQDGDLVISKICYFWGEGMDGALCLCRPRTVKCSSCAETRFTGNRSTPYLAMISSLCNSQKISFWINQAAGRLQSEHCCALILKSFQLGVGKVGQDWQTLAHPSRCVKSPRSTATRFKQLTDVLRSADRRLPSSTPRRKESCRPTEPCGHPAQRRKRSHESPVPGIERA